MSVEAPQKAPCPGPCPQGRAPSLRFRPHDQEILCAMLHHAAADKPLSQPRRRLTALNVWALSFGCSIGWGCFVMPGREFLPCAGPLGTFIAVLAGTLAMLGIR